MQYEIEYTILPYKNYKKEKNDLPNVTVKLKQEKYLIYLNDMRLTENITIEQKEFHLSLYPFS